MVPSQLFQENRWLGVSRMFRIVILISPTGIRIDQIVWWSTWVQSALHLFDSGVSPAILPL
jgi:hypothetical protein